MQEHEHGYCDRCGCVVEASQLTLDGKSVCLSCLLPALVEAKHARRPEARDDGR